MSTEHINVSLEKILAKNNISFQKKIRTLSKLGSFTVYSITSKDIIRSGFLKLRQNNARLAIIENEISVEQDEFKKNELIRSKLGNDKVLFEDLLREQGNHDPIQCVYAGEKYCNIAEGNRRWNEFLRISECNEHYSRIDHIAVDIWVTEQEDRDEVSWELEQRKHGAGATVKDHTPYENLWALNERIKSGPLKNILDQLPDYLDTSNSAKKIRRDVLREIRNKYPTTSKRIAELYVRAWKVFKTIVYPELYNIHNETGCPMSELLDASGIDWIKKLLNNNKLVSVLLKDGYLPIKECVRLITGHPEFDSSRKSWSFTGKCMHCNQLIAEEDLTVLIDQAAGNRQQITKIINQLKEGGVRSLKSLMNKLYDTDSLDNQIDKKNNSEDKNIVWKNLKNNIVLWFKEKNTADQIDFINEQISFTSELVNLHKYAH